MRENVADRAAGKWLRILPLLGIGEEFLRNKHGPCPACGGNDRFRFDDKWGKGNHVCNQCGNGDGFDLLHKVHSWDFAECARQVERVLGGDTSVVPKAELARRIESKKKDVQKVKADLNAVWAASKPVQMSDRDAVWTYLCRRGLDLKTVPKMIRSNRALDYYEKQPDAKRAKKIGAYPALVAKLQNPLGEPVCLHRIYLQKDRQAKSAKCKKLMTGVEDLAGCAIRLYKPTEELAVAEGIETALAVHQLTGLPVWATVSSSMMKTLIVPGEVKTVHIFADNDEKGAGLKAAKQLRERLVAEGKTVFIRMPKKVGEDYLDVYVELQKRQFQLKSAA